MEKKPISHNIYTTNCAVKFCSKIAFLHKITNTVSTTTVFGLRTCK